MNPLEPSTKTKCNLRDPRENYAGFEIFCSFEGMRTILIEQLFYLGDHTMTSPYTGQGNYSWINNQKMYFSNYTENVTEYSSVFI